MKWKFQMLTNYHQFEHWFYLEQSMFPKNLMKNRFNKRMYFCVCTRMYENYLI